MPEDKVIKSGQLTLPRIFFLAVVGGIIVATVALGGVWLSIGYWLLTLGLSVLLFLIAIDYGVKIDKVELGGHSSASAVLPEEQPPLEAPTAVQAGSRPKKRSSRPSKRRR
jgi:hypothetical protein